MKVFITAVDIRITEGIVIIPKTTMPGLFFTIKELSAVSAQKYNMAI
jgi:hypothetical protein